MRHLAGAALLGLWSAVATVTAGAVAAQTEPPRAPVVVELFTSQGCSSCPPADALLAELSKRTDVLPLALHVDYWDYIGWTDEFAHPAFSKRQKTYARNAGRRMVYTPQMIVGGHFEVAGYKPEKVLAAIAAEKAIRPKVRIDLQTGDNGSLTVRVTPLDSLDRPTDIILVRFIPVANVQIERGENAGKAMTYTNIVTDWIEIGKWSGQSAAEFAVPATPKSDAMSGAVLVQSAGLGDVLSAARLD